MNVSTIDYGLLRYSRSSLANDILFGSLPYDTENVLVGSECLFLIDLKERNWIVFYYVFFNSCNHYNICDASSVQFYFGFSLQRIMLMAHCGASEIITLLSVASKQWAPTLRVSCFLLCASATVQAQYILAFYWIYSFGICRSRQLRLLRLLCVPLNCTQVRGSDDSDCDSVCLVYKGLKKGNRFNTDNNPFQRKSSNALQQLNCTRSLSLAFCNSKICIISATICSEFL